MYGVCCTLNQKKTKKTLKLKNVFKNPSFFRPCMALAQSRFLNAAYWTV